MEQNTQTTNESTMPEELRIASWNVWGLLISKKRELRIKGISEHLKSLDADVIVLQELWKRKDYELIKEALGHSYKSIRFEGGLVGCGLAVFTKLDLVEGTVGFKEFSVRGRMWRFWEGDWFTGKGYVYLSLKHPQFPAPVHIINTHLQASYGGEYAVERAVQLLDIAEHLREVKTPFYVLAGDLNTHPQEVLPWAILTQSIPLVETNLLKDSTCNLPGNTWTKKAAKAELIDHILISPSLASARFTCEDVQKDGRSLSDHSLLRTEINILANPQSYVPAGLSLESVAAINKALTHQVQHLRRLKVIWSILSGVALLVCLAFAISASVLAMADPGSATALTVIMSILSPLGAALSLVFLAFALDAKAGKAALKNQMTEIANLTHNSVQAVPRKQQQ